MNILITGAAKRLGAAMAEHLAQQGYNIAIHYRSSEEAAEALAEKLRAQTKVKIALIQADLQNRDELLKIVERANDALGAPLDGLINNASSHLFDRVDSEPRDDFSTWDTNFATNLEAPFFLTRAFAAQCQEEGFVVNMIDQRVWRPTPNFASYQLAKSALLTFTKTSAMALAPKIRVNAIGPGTTLIGAEQSEENFAHHRKISILERGADIVDVLGALDYLIKARNVTGQMIAPDGGQHLIWQLPEA